MEQKHTPGPYTVEGLGSSYKNIFLDGKIWIGSVERGLAIEICNKLNQRLELLQQVAELEAERSELRNKVIEECLWFLGCNSAVPLDESQRQILNSLKTK